jgi:DGQHR domain-containing protein
LKTKIKRGGSPVITKLAQPGERKTNMRRTIKAQKFTHNDDTFFLCLLPADLLTEISYVARRGINDEKGAVQRILNKRRISGIRDFLLNDGFFPNNIILNVVDDSALEYNEQLHELALEVLPSVAQIIDGQHRIEGLKEAIKLDDTKKSLMIPTVLANDLSTERCAEIFVSINTEQKSVPKSLIYDLYGLMNSTAKDFSIERGTDIAKILNSDDNSPYQTLIKFPGSKRFRGGIQLSTFVNQLKPLVKSDGEFSKYQLATLDTQATVLKNYFNALQSYYDKKWYTQKNPFIFAAGFSAAIELLISKILPFCYSEKKFTEKFFQEVIIIPRNELIEQSIVKGLSGEAAKNAVRDRLIGFLNIDGVASEDDFEI